MNRRLLLIAALPLLLTAAAAFSGGRREKAAVPALVVYTYDAFGEELQDAIGRHFAENWNAAVTFQRFEDTGALYNRLYLERENPVADVAIGLDITYLARAYADGLFQAYKPAGLKVTDPALIVDPRYRVVPFDYGGVLLNVDTKALPNPPRTWEELTGPSLRRKIILMSPATSSPGRNFLLLTVAVFGEDKYLDFWRALKPNILTVSPGWSEGYGLYTQGEAPIVLSYDTSPAYHLEFEKETRYQSLVLGDSAYAQVEVAGIVRNSRNPENARRLMDYLVSPELQALIPLNQVMYPIHPEVALPESFRSVIRAAHLVSLDEERVAANFDRWLREWESVMQ